MAENKGVLPSSNVNTLGNANNKWENVYANKFTGAVAGNAATATALQTARSINGTNFNGTGNITTANWGTARNISIADATAANTGTGVSVNGSGNVTLKLPATIKATLTGNAATATKATQDSAGQQINTTYVKGLSISGNTITYTKGNGDTGSITVPTGTGYITESRYNADGSWYRKWSDGWLEQGSYLSHEGARETEPNPKKLTFLKAFKNTFYTINALLYAPAMDVSLGAGPTLVAKGTTNCDLLFNCEGVSHMKGAYWYACGMA